ncbi:phage major tail tube protein [Vibrio parahaemolyticus]|uniref:phage major tail tube protein n=1 Tax=Vibrio parahaemolyticus TaxID=670 RepID=UPI002F408EF1
MAENHATKRNHSAWWEETQYIGRLKAVTAEPQIKTETFSALGGIGDIEIPTGDYEALTVNVEFDNTSIGDLRLMTKNGNYVSGLKLACDVRAVDVDTGTRRIDGIATRIWGFVKNPPTTFHTKEKVAYTAQIACYRIEISDATGRVFELDFVNGVRYPEDVPGDGGFTITF